MWSLVAVLALLLAVAAAVLVAFAVQSRRQFTRLPGVFRCRVRLVRGVVPGVAHTWRARPVWASWAHDVLLVRLGRFPAITQALKVRFPEGSVAAVPSAHLRGLGRQPVMLRLRLDDGDLVEVAAPSSDRELLSGPFLVACLTGDPEGTDRRRPER